MFKRNLFYAAIVAFACTMAFSCKKGVEGPGNGNPNLDTAHSTLADRYYDSVFLYAKEIYYWYDQLPAYEDFLPRKFKSGDTLDGLASEVFAITRFGKMPSGRLYEQAFDVNKQGDRVDDNSHAKYSYIMRTSDARNGGAVSHIDLNIDYSRKLKMTLDGRENNLGFVLGFIPASFTFKTADSIYIEGQDSTVGFVRFVTKESPAYHAGLRRGDLISAINGFALNYEENFEEILNALEGRTISLTTYKPSTNTKKTISFNKALYQFNPFFKDTVVTAEGKQIGYVAYKSFTEYDSSSKEPLIAAMEKFGAAGIQDLVIDLRYNGGGSVETAENFVDYIAPASSNGKVMLTNYYNKLMQDKKATILKKLPQRDADDRIKPGKTYWDYDYSINGNTDRINKKGNVEISRVYFIVSSNTASASEMMINSIKAYLPVTLIGAWFSDDGKLTYGKPVGFFEVIIGEEGKSYSMWLSNFETKNAKGEGGYFEGMSTHYQAFDDIRYDFGDPREQCFREAIRKILNNPTYNYKPPVSMSRNGAVRSKATDPGKIINGRGYSLGEVTPIRDMVIKPKN